MVSEEPEMQYVLCSWCGYRTFYPLENSVMLAMCANCGNLKALENFEKQDTTSIVDLK